MGDLLILKTLLGISTEDTSKDMLLQFALDEAQQTVLNYCNLEDVPEGLQSTMIRMAMDVYRCDGLGKQDQTTAVSSFSEGDTKISFSSNASDFQGSIIKDYQKQLNRYRKVGW